MTEEEEEKAEEEEEEEEEEAVQDSRKAGQENWKARFFVSCLPGTEASYHTSGDLGPFCFNVASF
jgi:hypothetical protein